MQLPKQYPYAVAVALGMSIHAWVEGASVGMMRKKLFNKAFMEKQFGSVHSTQLGHKITPNGYPDMGNGLYSQKLSYRDWYKFNVYQRIHHNYLEALSFAQVSVLSSGIYNPKRAALIGLLYIFGRSLYSFFYKKDKGAQNKGRIAGALICVLAMLINSGIFFTNFVKSLK